MTPDVEAGGPTGTVTDPDAPEPEGSPKKKKKGSFFRELPFLVAVALALALLIKAFLVQAFYIPSGSMEQTLLVGDRVLVNKVSYRVGEIQRGDVVVFNGLDSFSPEVVVVEPSGPVERVTRWVGGVLGLGQPGEKDFIKRVIGIPGDTVACCTNGHVTVAPVGRPPVELKESYLFEDDLQPFGPVKVPEGRLWVMGDHRSMSADSRAHVGDSHQGTVPASKVIGKAFVIVWPPSRWGMISTPSTFSQAGLDPLSDSNGSTTTSPPPQSPMPRPATLSLAMPAMILLRPRTWSSLM